MKTATSANSTNNQHTDMTFYVSLPNRGLIHIEGPDRFEFLQALITNDLEKLSAEQMVYACLLTPQGKFLHDFFCIWGKDFILLDCEGGERAQDLYRRLNMYRLRKDVQISVEEQNEVYAVFGEPLGLPDPRDPEMGSRTFEKPEGIVSKPFGEWDIHRIKLGIPDGSRDLIPDKSTMDEGNMDQINAIDYDKGCYIGQELTARMHYRGLGKRKLQYVDANDPPEGAEIRSQCDDAAIALIRKS